MRRERYSFNVVFAWVVGFTVACAAGAELMAYFPPRVDHGQTDALLSAFKMGTGAVVGLLGGRGAG